MNNFIRSSVVAAAAFAVAGSTGSQVTAESFVLAHAMPTTHVLEPASQRFISELGARNGPEVEYHPAGALGDWTSLFEQVSEGAIPMSVTWGVSEVDKRLDLAFLSFVAEDWESGRQLFGPGGSMIGVYNGILADNGMQLLGTVPSGFGSIAIRKGIDAEPVNFPEDGAGIKMRVPGLPIAVERFNAWGFSPVPMPFDELHTALQLGTIDARSFGPPAEIIQMKDVIGTYILTRDYFEFAYWLANKEWWDGLAPADREAIQASVDEAVTWAWDNAEEQETRLLEEIEAAGIKVIELTDEQRQVAKSILLETEWRWADDALGKDLIAQVRAATQ